MGRGRKPKSSAERDLGGNAGHRPPGTLEPEFKPLSELPKCPTGLTGEGKQQWALIGGILVQERRLTELQLKLLETYCVAAYHHKKANKILKKSGYIALTAKGETKVSPMVSVVDKFARQLLRLATALGIPIADYSRITVPKKSKTSGFGSI